MSWSPAAGGLTSSRWNSPPNQAQPLRQIYNVAPGHTPNMKSNIPPHLQNFRPNTLTTAEQHVQTPKAKLAYVPPHLQNSRPNQSTPGQHVQTPEAKPAFIPPHLRGFNTPSMVTPTLRQSIPTHLQAKPAPLNVSQESVTLVKNSPFMDNGTQNQTQRFSHNGFQTVATPPATLQKESTKPADQPLSGTKPADDAFLSFLNKKVTATTEAKKKEVAEKARLAAEQPQHVQTLKGESPWSTPNETQPSSLAPRRSKFRPNTETDQAFQSFLHEQIKGPITNGKKYTFTSGQQSPQTLPVTSKPVAKAVTPLQMPNSNTNASKSPFGAMDPHSAFSPGGTAAKTSPQFMSNDAAVDALVEPGFEPQDSNEGFYDKVGNSGVQENAKENVRASQGLDPKDEFLDWDGKSWRPPPCDWENDRSAFDNSFMGKYIRQDWVPSVPSGSDVEVDTKDPKFELAVSVGENGFETPIEHPMTIPDLENSDNQEKQRLQTAAVASKNHSRKLEKQAKAKEVRAKATQMHHRQFIEQVQAQDTEEHPHKPRIDVYLRPAIETDWKGIADIYNHYTLNSLVTEDQTAITEENVKYLIDTAERDKLPIIVAIQGKMPLPSPERFAQPKKVSFPQFEDIIGFGWAEGWGWGLDFTRNGRSRFTACLQFYVHPEYTRKKIGQSLLDRLIQTLSHGYGAKDGYDWMNPADDPVYKSGGVQKFHQLIIQYAVEQKNDLNYQWMKNFLRRYFFDEGGRLQRIARSSPAGAEAKFADVVFFQKEVAAGNEFGAFI